MKLTNNEIVSNTVYRTTDYDLFKRLEGNRAVLSNRVNKIIKSIKKNGYIMNPIIVNEKYEVIDGQGRLEALRVMNLPVDYIVIKGLGREQCIALNAYSTIWSMVDYISAYCEDGNENYIRLQEVIDAFPEINTPIKIILVTGVASVQSSSIKAGTIKVTSEMAEQAKKDLTFARQFMGPLQRVRGTSQYYIYALVFAKKCGASQGRLLDVIENNVLPPAPNLRIALDTVSDLYNKNLKIKENRIYLYKDYEDTMTDKYGWYGSKWGKNNDR